MSGEGFRSVIEVSGVFVFREAGSIEHLCELSGLLRGVWVGGGRHRVEVERVKESPLLIWGHEGIFHELIEGFEALNVNFNGVLVAILSSVESILLSVTDTTKIAHGCFVFYV